MNSTELSSVCGKFKADEKNIHENSAPPFYSDNTH